MRVSAVLVRACVTSVALLASAPVARAQTAASSAADGFTLPDSDRLRVTLDFLAGYSEDRANTTLGFERQGRAAYAIFSARGRLNSRVSYLISVNPVNETQPVPGCGAAGYYYPNNPAALYGANTTVPCDPRFGDRRVDEYRGIALDVVPQQGPIREAYVDLGLAKGLRLRFGRTRLPIGWDWQEAGSLTAKDAPRIQRINAQDNFGAMASYASPAADGRKPRYALDAAVHLGDGNRWWDYDYFYFEDGAFGTNSGVTMLLSGRYAPTSNLEIRGSFQHGATGSKVERLPSYWASKRNDDARVIGVEYRPIRAVRLIAERAEYIWGPTATSADMLRVDPRPVHKKGEYVTLEVTQPVHRNVTLGGSLSAERIGRADSLVKFMVAAGDMHVTPGRRDGMLVGRLFVDIGRQLRIGMFRTIDANPFPWLSGITPVTGFRAFSRASTNKWGIVTRFQVR